MALQKQEESRRVQVRRKGKSLSATLGIRADAWAIAAEAQILAGAIVESRTCNGFGPVN
ncbi:hypothetical protein [Sphingobium fontiphilum]|uniref:hypothetical protein n=1 Tax=Sphingobium fontiphilum TaxID=944425 RepID=UPI001620DA5B|nr:hypothetical protein [Sphingobium fontiphilum]